MPELHSTAVGLRNIVVATDFSDTSDLAVKHAAGLARSSGAKLYLVHGYTNAVYWVGPARPLIVPPSYEEQLLQDTRERIHAAVAELEDQGIRAEALVIAALGTEAVLHAANEVDADLVVTGTRGHTGFKHLLLGSTAEEIVRTAGRPVLSIHPGDEPPADGPIRILLPTDFSDDATQALEQAVGLLAQNPSDCALVLAHVIHTPTLLSPVVSDLAIREVFLDEAREAAHTGLEALAQGFRQAGHPTEIRVLEGDPADVLAETARETEVTLIAMGTRGLTGLKRLVQGAVADRTVRHAHCPVLTVPRTGDDGT